jgi:hypothetical protein
MPATIAPIDFALVKPALNRLECPIFIISRDYRDSCQSLLKHLKISKKCALLAEWQQKYWK